MAAIISIFNGKGGVGKTTLALCLYETLKKGGFFDEEPDVALVDADPQKSVINLVNVMELPVKAYALADVRKNISSLADIVIIDNPPYLRSGAIKQLPKSDIIVLPCKPSPQDALGLLQTIKSLKSFKLLNKSRVVFTMVKPNSSYLNELKEQISSYEIPTLKTQIGDRIAFNKALASGSLYSQRDKKAIGEVESFANEILNIIYNG